jgi:hypothetical protein
LRAEVQGLDIPWHWRVGGRRGKSQKLGSGAVAEYLAGAFSGYRREAVMAVMVMVRHRGLCILLAMRPVLWEFPRMKTPTTCGTVTADDRRRIRLPDEFFTSLPTRKLQWVKIGCQLVLEPIPEPNLKRIRKVIACVKEFRREHPITDEELKRLSDESLGVWG